MVQTRGQGSSETLVIKNFFLELKYKLSDKAEKGKEHAVVLKMCILCVCNMEQAIHVSSI